MCFFFQSFFRKAPQKPGPWHGTFDAFDFANDCIQPNSENNEYTIGSEDCLYLNVFVPSWYMPAMNATVTKLPVLFYIFGGRFIFGSARHYAPDLFIEKNVIVVIRTRRNDSRASSHVINHMEIKCQNDSFQVTINYRLGPFGFLSLDTHDYSGNMGMKDQILALKWVNENIDRFGGDRNQITLMGHSCGRVNVNGIFVTYFSLDKNFSLILIDLN